MPIYCYKCNNCRYEFEYMVLNKNEDIVCPKCCTKRITKQIGQTTFRLKGGGWANQGYQKKGEDIC